MGCVSSSLVDDDEFPQMQIGSTGLSHHFVSLTSTTYGLLSLDPPPPPSPLTPPLPPPRFTLKETEAAAAAEVINSWELMAGLDSSSTSPFTAHHSHTSSFRFCPFPLSNNSDDSKPSKPKTKPVDIENANPNLNYNRLLKPPPPLDLDLHINVDPPRPKSYSLDEFPELCPPNGGDKVVLYTTSLRGVRSTFEACNAVRSTLRGLGFSLIERDISMDRGFRDELHRLLRSPLPPPRLFIKGRYIGGSQDVLTIHEDGGLIHLLRGLPTHNIASVCDGCGDARFLPCFQCSGSCKLLTDNSLLIRCPHCNENGLVLCPICT